MIIITKTLAEIALQLEKPFPIECIELLPKGQFEKDGKISCMALPYADVRVYEDRLNTLVPGEWSTPPPTAIVAGQKLIVYVTVIVCGIPHSDVGEAFLVSANGTPSENAATESWAQAFKRACSQFGLGRYLYDLEKAWVPYNKQRKVIDLDSAAIARTIYGMYKKAGIPCKESPQNGKPQEAPSNQPTPIDLKKRFYAVYDQCKAANLFETQDGKKDENKASFFKFAGRVLKANVTNETQLTASRLDTLEQYAAKFQQAAS